LSLVFDISRQALISTGLWNTQLRCRLLTSGYTPNAEHDDHRGYVGPGRGLYAGDLRLSHEGGVAMWSMKTQDSLTITAVDPNFFESSTQVLNGDNIATLDIRMITEFIARPVTFSSTSVGTPAYLLVETFDSVPVAIFAIDNASSLTGATLRISFTDDLAISYENDFTLSLAVMAFIAEVQPVITIAESESGIVINTTIPTGYELRLYRAVSDAGITTARYTGLVTLQAHQLPYTDTTVIAGNTYKYQASLIVPAKGVISPKSKPVIRAVTSI
jgi:hypothetical protein